MILAKLEFSDMWNLFCSVPRIYRFCDYDYWKRRVHQEYRVPFWYFDLNKDTPAPGIRRYLQTVSKYTLLPETRYLCSEEEFKGLCLLHGNFSFSDDDRNYKICVLSNLGLGHCPDYMDSIGTLLKDLDLLCYWINKENYEKISEIISNDPIKTSLLML